ncbi:hypothetical protein BTO30_12660 [Domibacillus antri]|uniref:Uncharacterized protein n=1 Tax=Domibacillus antri TaxID=1714264 RepID=A0A1Q8Q3D1_9BACI|nr:hypothetical protein [Domibacillus antri]OLN21863.1 hypothetical protein BTO30_12660 [Domibacillus antri]
MARQSKIEKFGCEEIVLNGIRSDPPKSTREIAKECSEWAGETISHTAVARFVESMNQIEQKKEVVKQDQRRVLKHVNQEFDIIQMQYRTTERLLNRFELLDDLPEYFKDQIDELINKIATIHEDDGVVPLEYLEGWQEAFEKEMKRKVLEIATLNRELRENSKFLADMRGKAFEFSLIQEYLSIFMDIFKDASPEAYTVAVRKIAANPRMQKIVEQQELLRGDG